MVSFGLIVTEIIMNGGVYHYSDIPLPIDDPVIKIGGINENGNMG